VSVPATVAGTSAPAFAHDSRHDDDRTPVPFPTKVSIASPRSASRTDRRPVGGGVYDPIAKKTYISWGGPLQDNYVQEYNHRKDTWSAPVKVGGGGDDAHNYPTLVQADDGHVLVFRGIHNRDLMMARSPKPRSVEGVWTDTLIPDGLGATYPMPIKTANGDIYVFVRETVRDFDRAYPTDFRPIKYVRSTDNGKTWVSSATLTGEKWNIAPIDRPDNMNEIYIGQMRLEPANRHHKERIAISYTLAGGGPEGHLHDRYHKNMYYVTFNPRNQHFYSVDGTDLGVKIDDAKQEQSLKIVDTPLQMPNPRSPQYISLVGTTVGGRFPFVVWMRFDLAGGVHVYSSVNVPGAGWQTREIGREYAAREMEQVDDFTWRIYGLPSGATATGLEVHRLTLGNNAQREGTLAAGKKMGRVELIGGYRNPMRILAAGAPSAPELTVADGDIHVFGN
jgi:hypothetical protein